MNAPRRTPQVFGFTTPHTGIANVLKSDIVISEEFDPNSCLSIPAGKPYIGVWDTGASGTVINSKIVTELNLKPSGKRWVYAVGGDGKVNKYLADTYSVNVSLPNKVTIVGVVASQGEIMNADALIGMDILGCGDLAITNFNGKTTISYRTPSIQEIDFVKQINEINARTMPKVGRNALCPCGSGKKYKNCHWSS